MVDFLVLDCSSGMTNVFTPAAIESGDLVIRILTPDLKGINYLKAHQPLLTDGRFHYEEHLTFAGMARPFHAFDEMGYIIGGFDGLLPYGKELDRCATEGGMFQAVKYCNSKYTASLNKVLDALEQMEAAEQAEEYWTEESLEPEDSTAQDADGYDNYSDFRPSRKGRRRKKPIYENRTVKYGGPYAADEPDGDFADSEPDNSEYGYGEEDADEQPE